VGEEQDLEMGYPEEAEESSNMTCWKWLKDRLKWLEDWLKLLKDR